MEIIAIQRYDDKMVYEIKRIETEDDIAGIKLGLAVLLPVYSRKRRIIVN